MRLSNLVRICSLLFLGMFLVVSTAKAGGKVRAVTIEDLIVHGVDFSGQSVEFQALVQPFMSDPNEAFLRSPHIGGPGAASTPDPIALARAPKIFAEAATGASAVTQYLMQNCAYPCVAYVRGSVSGSGSELKVVIYGISATPTVAPVDRASAPAENGNNEPVGDMSCVTNTPRDNIPVGDGKVQQAPAKQPGFFGQLKRDAMAQALGGLAAPSGPLYSKYHSISATPLSCLFSRHPYRNGATIWPRVAITVLSMPNGGDEQFTANSVYTNGCWSLKAKIWYSTTESADVPPFQWCGIELAYNLAMVDYGSWVAGSAAYMEGAGGGDDSNSSEGPGYPGSAVPRGPNIPDLSTPNNGNGQMAANIVYRMGLNWNQPDGRVWFNLAK